jgi:hypothetical protein
MKRKIPNHNSQIPNGKNQMTKFKTQIPNDKNQMINFKFQMKKFSRRARLTVFYIRLNITICLNPMVLTMG